MARFCRTSVDMFFEFGGRFFVTDVSIMLLLEVVGLMVLKNKYQTPAAVVVLIRSSEMIEFVNWKFNQDWRLMRGGSNHEICFCCAVRSCVRATGLDS